MNGTGRIARMQRRNVHIGLWVLQVTLAVFFLLHGLAYTLQPPPVATALAQLNIASGFALFIGVAELFAAAGLLLPGITRILPQLTPLTAIGLMIVTLSATLLHLSRGEFASMGLSMIMLMLAGCVAYGRLWVVGL